MDRALVRMWQKVWVLVGTWQNEQGLNQDVAKKCGSKWELGKMDRTLIRMWQKKGGSKWEPDGNLAKCLGL